MEREGKDKEGERENQELVRIKLKRGIVVGKREGNSTPPPTWKFGLFQNDGSLLQEFNFPSNNNTILSARKLAANLWEIQPKLQVIKMTQHSKKVNSKHIHQLLKQKASSEVKRKGIKDNHKSGERNGDSLQASTVASYSSSMEIGPFRPKFVPSSLKFKRQFGEPNFNLTTTAELKRVLNRIWILEEQHISAKSIAKALKRKLDHSQTRIRELKLEKKRDQDHIVQSIKQELEDERRLRKQSEVLHRKLGRQLSEVKSAYADALRGVERERNARVFLEELCDEFAKGIQEYDKEALFLKQKNENDDAGTLDNDGLILHLSEAWLDERMQIKRSDKQKVSCEIETLLQAKRELKPKRVKKIQSEEATKKDYSLKLETGNEESRKDDRKQKMNVKNTKGPVEITPLESNSPQNMKISELIQKDAEQRTKKYYLQAMLHRTNSLPVKSKQMQLERRHAGYAFDPEKFIGPLSPVEKWTSTATTRVHEISECSKRSQSVRENTLQALLLEARLDTQKDRSRTAKA